MRRWLKWTLITTGVLGMIVGAVAAVGSILPLDHVAAVTATYSRTPEEVWGVITDFENGASWREGLIRVERAPDRNGHPVWVEYSKFGALPLEVSEALPSRRLVLVIAADDLGFGGSWTFDIEPAGDGSRLTITERGRITNPFFRFMSRFVFGYDGTMKGYVRSLDRRLGEPGEPGTEA